MGHFTTNHLGLAQQEGNPSPVIGGNAIDLPSIPNRPGSPKMDLARSKKERKYLRIGEKRKPKSGKLKKASRELAEVSLCSIPEEQVAQPSQEISINPSSLFSACTVLCGGSISS